MISWPFPFKWDVEGVAAEIAEFHGYSSLSMDSCTDRCTGLIEQLLRMRIRMRTTSKVDFELENLFLNKFTSPGPNGRRIHKEEKFRDFGFSNDLSTMDFFLKILPGTIFGKVTG
jgi:hypothetical protein